MRADLRKVIFLESANKKKRKRTQTGENVFRSYALKGDIGQKILNGLFEKTVVDEETQVRHFIMDDIEKRTGFLSDVYACVGIFSLINRLKVELTPEQKEDLSKTVGWILDYIKENGFTMNPYLQGSAALFSRKTPFYGAMTWCLSLLSNLCRSWRNNYFEVDEKKQKAAYNMMVTIIQAFNEGAKTDENGNCIGWSFTVEGKQPSLFYTYSVLEAFSDFEDSVLGGEDVDAEDIFEEEDDRDDAAIATRDKKLVAYLKEKIDPKDLPNGTNVNGLKYWRECCFSAAKHVWQKAEGIIKKNFIGDNFFTEDGVVPEIKESDILKSSTSNALFNTLFVVFTGIYGYVNKVDQDGNNENIESVMETMREALQNVQKTYEMLSQRGMEYIVDSYSLLFQAGAGKNATEFEKKCSLKLNSENIFDSSLLPLLVKSNSILAIYIQQFPQKEMGQHFENLFGKISISDWENKEVFLWDVNKYNVKNTERYLEAVADFYEYFETYEKGYVDVKEQTDATIAQEIEKAKPIWKQEVSRDLKAKYEKDFKEWQEEESQKHQFEQLFSKEIKRLATEVVEEKIIETMDHIIEARAHNNMQELSGFESAFAQRFGAVLMSLMDKYLVELYYSGMSVEQLHKVVEKDVDAFMKKYATALADSLGDDKPVLTEAVFKAKTKEE